MHNVRLRDLERAASKRGQQVKIRLLNFFSPICNFVVFLKMNVPESDIPATMRPTGL